MNSLGGAPGATLGISVCVCICVCLCLEQVWAEDATRRAGTQSHSCKMGGS